MKPQSHRGTEEVKTRPLGKPERRKVVASLQRKRRFLPAAFPVLCLCASVACSGSAAPIDFDDINLPPLGPIELESRLKAFREGTERHHGDPKQVAHTALLYAVDVPWRGDPFRAEDYEFHERNPERPEWGPYVVRGWAEADRARRYRVKIRPYEEIWYPIQVSRYIVVDLPDDDPRDTPPDVRK